MKKEFKDTPQVKKMHRIGGCCFWVCYKETYLQVGSLLKESESFCYPEKQHWKPKGWCLESLIMI